MSTLKEENRIRIVMGTLGALANESPTKSIVDSEE
jgi:hypothetical protein